MSIVKITNYEESLPMSEMIYPTTLEYRLYKIKTSEKAGKAFATIYDGTKKVFQTYGNNMGSAAVKARRWIDEQEELSAEYDLHMV